LGQKSGQGFYPYPKPDDEQPAGSSSKVASSSTFASSSKVDDDAKVEVVKLETREDGVAIAWLANGQMNSISPQVVEDLGKVWRAVEEAGVRALVIASSNPFLYCAGADIKAFTTMDEAAGEDLIHRAHALFRELGSGRVATIAAVNGLAFGGGCELAMACDVRLAARSAIFSQPEVKLGIIPGFGGTQRLPRLVGPAKALEMNLIGDPLLAEDALEHGLVNRVFEDHELIDGALAWARRLASQAPLAIEQIKRVSGAGDLDEGIEAEKRAFATVFQSEDGREGIAAFLGKRAPRFEGR
ncbi:MAG TPA: enoyl-CoA hydratase-related protein, partial [Solirubrobacteraceae bacterium]|nr:enoyl-CoA hydratase-related protein [Solirubrobacteraceae bacterium]